MALLQLGDETAPTAVVHFWGTQLSQKLCAAQQVTQAQALLVLRVVCGLLSWYGLCMHQELPSDKWLGVHLMQYSRHWWCLWPKLCSC